MQIRHLLLWMVIASLSYALFMIAKRGIRLNRAPLIQFGLILAVAIGALLTERAILVALAMLGFALAVVVPAMLSSLAQRAIAADRLGQAKVLLWIVGALQPSVGATSQYELVKTLWQARLEAEDGSVDPLKVLKRELEGRLARTDHTAVDAAEELVALACLDRRWDEAIATFEQHLVGHPVRASVLPHLVRAYSERGELEAALDCMAELERQMASESSQGAHESLSVLRDHVRLLLLAFAGEAQALNEFVGSRSAGKRLPPAQQAYWRGVAQMRRGSTDLAIDELTRAQELTSGDDARALAAINARLAEARSGPPAIAVDATLAKKIAELKEAIAHELELPRVGTGLGSAAWVTTGLIALNVLVTIVIEILGGSTNPWTLLGAGANFPRAVAAGETWRLVSAMFLHIGPLHLFFNCYGLYYLGGFVERIIGPSRLLFIFVASGVVGNAAGYVLHKTTLSAGASGAVLGLLGAGIALLLSRKLPARLGADAGWRRRYLMIFVFLALLQLAFGLTAKFVDNAAHFGGLFTGFVLGLLLIPRRAGLAKSSPSAVHRAVGVTLGALALAGLAYGLFGVVMAQGRVGLGPQRYQEVHGAGVALSVPADWRTEVGPRSVSMEDGLDVWVRALSVVGDASSAGERLDHLLTVVGDERMAKERGEKNVLEVKWLERPTVGAPRAEPGGVRSATGLIEMTVKLGDLRRMRMRVRLDMLRTDGRDALLELRYPTAAERTYRATFGVIRTSFRVQSDPGGAKK